MAKRYPWETEENTAIASMGKDKNGKYPWEDGYIAPTTKILSSGDMLIRSDIQEKLINTKLSANQTIQKIRNEQDKKTTAAEQPEPDTQQKSALLKTLTTPILSQITKKPADTAKESTLPAETIKKLKTEPLSVTSAIENVSKGTAAKKQATEKPDSSLESKSPTGFVEFLASPASAKNIVDWTEKNIVAGAGVFNKGVMGLLSALGGEKVPLVKDVIKYYKNDSQIAIEAANKVNKSGASKFLGESVQSTVAMLPSLVLTILSGGTAAPLLSATAPTIGELSTLPRFSKILYEVAETAKIKPDMIPMFITSFGGAYEEARQEGADWVQAVTRALFNAYPETIIEQSGGFQTLIPGLKSGEAAAKGLTKEMLKSIFEEMGEEIQQSIFEGLSKKATYKPGVPYFGVGETEAVVNPTQMAKAAAQAGLVAGALGGAAALSTDTQPQSAGKTIQPQPTTAEQQLQQEITTPQPARSEQIAEELRQAAAGQKQASTGTTVPTTATETIQETGKKAEQQQPASTADILEPWEMDYVLQRLTPEKLKTYLEQGQNVNRDMLNTDELQKVYDNFVANKTLAAQAEVKPVETEKVEPITEQPIKIKVYQGKGATAQEVYGQFKTPVLGKAEYYAFDKNTAGKYSDNIRESEIQLEKPYTIKTPQEYNDLLKMAGVEIDNPAGLNKTSEVKAWANKVKKAVTDNGYDGIILQFDSPENAADDSYNVLYDVFGHDQVVVYDKAQSTQEAINLGAEKSTIANSVKSDNIVTGGDNYVSARNVPGEGRDVTGGSGGDIQLLRDNAAKETTLRKALQYLERTGTERINAEIETGTVPGQQKIQGLMSELGIDVVFYKSDTKIPINGMFDPDLQNVVFIRSSDNKNMLWAVGHEFFHTLQVNHSDLYDIVMEFYKDTITPEQRSKFLETFNKTPGLKEVYSNNENILISEMLADESGNVFIKQSFWESVYEKSKELFEKLVNIAREFLSGLKGTRYNNYLTRQQTERFEKDFEAVITAVRERVKENKGAGKSDKRLPLSELSAREKEEQALSTNVKPQYDERISTEGPEDIRDKYKGEFHTISKIKQDKFDVGEFIDKVYDKTFDALQELNRLGKAFGQKPSEGLYAKALASKMSDKQARIIMTQRMIDSKGNTIGKSLKDVLSPLDKDKRLMSIFDDYLVYKHAPSWMKKGKTVFAKDLNLTIEDVQKRAAEIEAEHPEFVQMQKDLIQFQRQLAESWLVDTGILSQDAWNKFLADYPDYVPLMRSFAKVEGKGGYRPKSGYVNQTSPVKKAKGSERDIISPIESIIEHIGQYTKVAKRNEAGQAFLDIVRGNQEELEGIAKELWPEIVYLGGPGKVVAAQVLDSDGKTIENLYFQKSLEDNGIDGVMETLTRLYQFQDSGAGKVAGGRKINGKIVTVIKDGKPVHIEVMDEALLNALMSLTPRQQLGVTKAIGAVTKTMKNLTTGWNLSFGVARNLWKDFVTGYVSSKTINANPLLYFKYAGEIFAAIGDTLAGGVESKVGEGKLGGFVNKMAEQYRSYQNMGGGAFASSLASDVRQLERAKKDLLGKKNAGNYLINFLETLNNTLESAPRIAEYKRVVKKEGYTYQGRSKAIFEANDLTVNFSRFGDDVKAADNYIPFLNAAMQGVDKTVRTYKDNPVNAILKSIYSVTIPSIILYLINHKDDETEEAYNMLNNYTKDNYFCIAYKDSEGVKFIKIPKPREIGTVFGALPERILRAWRDNDPDAFKDYSDTIVQNWMPPDPLTDNIAFPAFRSLALGKNWRMNDLESYAEKEMSPRYRFDEKTSGVSKFIGDKLNVSPKRLDDFWRSYMGGVAQYGIPLTSEAGGTAGKTFVQQVTADPVYSTDYLNNFYTLRNSLTTKEADEDAGKYTMTDIEKSSLIKMKKTADNLSKARKIVNADKITKNDIGWLKNNLKIDISGVDDSVKAKRAIRLGMNVLAKDKYDEVTDILAAKEKTP